MNRNVRSCLAILMLMIIILGGTTVQAQTFNGNFFDKNFVVSQEKKTEPDSETSQKVEEVQSESNDTILNAEATKNQDSSIAVQLKHAGKAIDLLKAQSSRSRLAGSSNNHSGRTQIINQQAELEPRFKSIEEPTDLGSEPAKVSLYLNASSVGLLRSELNSLVNAKKHRKITYGEIFLLQEKKNMLWLNDPSLKMVLQSLWSERPVIIRLIDSLPASPAISQLPTWIIRQDGNDHVVDGRRDLLAVFNAEGRCVECGK